MDGTFSVSLSGGNAFSDFAREWQARMGEKFALPPYSRATVAGFRARSRGFRLRDLIFNDFENAAALRTAGPRVGAEDHLRLWIVHRGGWRFGAPGGAEHGAPAGRFLVQAGRLSYFAAMPRSSAQVLVLPAVEISRPRGTAASGRADTAEVRLLTAHATMVRRVLDDLEPAGADAARETLAELARAVVHGGLDDVEPRLAPALTQAARDLADRRLTDPELSPAAVARQLNVSVRTLQRAFAAEGQSMSAYIRWRRLDEARRALIARPGRMTVTEIAARWQFADGSHFTRLFRDRYGQTPTDYVAEPASREVVTLPRGRHRPVPTSRQSNDLGARARH
jgi:AraC-like DNA-binding protein